MSKELKINFPLLKVKQKILVMFLLLWWNTMTKETLKKINWEYYFRGLEFIKVKQGHGSRDSERLHIDPLVEGR